MIKPFGFGVIALMWFGLICIVVATALDYWAYFDNESVNIHAGLWRMCTEVKSTSNQTCTSIEVSGDYHTIRAMLILALLFVCGGICCVVLKLFWLRDNQIVLYSASGVLAFAGLFLLIGFAIYRTNTFHTIKDSYPNISLHAGFAFCIISWLVTWTAAGATVLMVFIKELD